VQLLAVLAAASVVDRDGFDDVGMKVPELAVRTVVPPVHLEVPLDQCEVGDRVAVRQRIPRRGVPLDRVALALLAAAIVAILMEELWIVVAAVAIVALAAFVAWTFFNGDSWY
jgi:hypothetical protein